jgi:hypothetical protein
MHLRQRGSGHRRVVELGEQPLRWLPQLAGDQGDDLGGGHRIDAILQRRKTGERVGRHDVGPGRQHLAELDEHATGLLEASSEVETGPVCWHAVAQAHASVLDPSSQAVFHGQEADLGQTTGPCPSPAYGLQRAWATQAERRFVTGAGVPEQAERRSADQGGEKGDHHEVHSVQLTPWVVDPEERAAAYPDQKTDEHGNRMPYDRQVPTQEPTNNRCRHPQPDQIPDRPADQPLQLRWRVTPQSFLHWLLTTDE